MGSSSDVRCWWVNQNQTYRAEVRGSFMWSPKQNANGVSNQFYENMREVSPGNVVFSFFDTRIKAIGVVTGAAQAGPKPDFGSASANWSQEGWFVPVDYCILENQIRPRITRPPTPDRTLPGPTFRDQIVRARRGQGVFSLLQRVEHEVGVHRHGHPPADDPPCKHVDHERDVDEPTPRVGVIRSGGRIGYAA